MDVFLLHFLCGSLTSLSAELFTKMLQQNYFKRVEKRSHFYPCFLAFEVFQHNIEALDTSMGGNQQADSLCSVALLFC